MVGANLKAEAMALMDRRTELEAQMNAIIQRLCQPGGPGISGSLVDSEVSCFSIFTIIMILNFRFIFLQFLGYQTDS